MAAEGARGHGEHEHILLLRTQGDVSTEQTPTMPYLAASLVSQSDPIAKVRVGRSLDAAWCCRPLMRLAADAVHFLAETHWNR